MSNPIEDRARLRGEHTSAQGAFDQGSARLREIEREVSQLRRELVDANAAKARGRGGAEQRVSEAEQRYAQLLEEARSTKAAVEGAASARTQINNELADLHRAELDTFAEHAEQSTRDALEAFAALEEPYQRAVSAWQRARSEWSPLQQAIYERITQAWVRDGVYPSQENARQRSVVPGMPIQVPDGVFAAITRPGIAPRPPALGEPETQDAAA